MEFSHAFLLSFLPSCYLSYLSKNSPFAGIYFNDLPATANVPNWSNLFYKPCQESFQFILPSIQWKWNKEKGIYLEFCANLLSLAIAHAAHNLQNWTIRYFLLKINKIHFLNPSGTKSNSILIKIHSWWYKTSDLNDV